jgi:cytochrome c553
MSFRRFLGLAGLMAATSALAQGTPDQAAQVIAAPEPAAAEVSALADDSQPAGPGDAAAGASKAAVCAACHGMDGNSADPQYPKLAGQHEIYIARHLALYRSGERENAIMLGFAAALSPQDMRDLGAFYATQTVRPGVADESLITEGPNEGRKFYEVGQKLYMGGDVDRGVPACAACHGPSGLGNPGPSYPLLSGQHAQYTAAQLKAYRDGAVYGRGDNANAVMAGVARYLTDEEIQALATYIEGLHPAE